MARHRCARHLTTAAVVGCIPIPRRWEVGLFNEVTSKETEAAHFQSKRELIEELSAEKAKEAEVFTCKNLPPRIRRQEELRFLQ
jgi:hypothetical protein